MPLSTAEILVRRRKLIVTTLLYSSIVSTTIWLVPSVIFGQIIFGISSIAFASLWLFLFFLSGTAFYIAFFDWVKHFLILPRAITILIIDVITLPLAHKLGLFSATAGFISYLSILLLIRGVITYHLYLKRIRLVF